jgi:dihydrolipoamide dehydrogenase
MVVGEIANERELVVVGGGPGGYNAAIRAAQLGLEVTLIEKEKVGGVCLNEGCIPSKVFTHAAEKMSSIPHLGDIGIGIGLGTEKATIDLEKLQAYKEKVVGTLTKGVQGLLKQNGVEVVKGTAAFMSADRIGVENGDHFEIYQFEKAIVAVGSQSVILTDSDIEIDGERIVDPNSVYELKTIPGELTVYGSDYLSLEAAMSFHAFGSRVNLVLDGGKKDFPFDFSINRELKRQLKKSRIKVYYSCELKSAKADRQRVDIRLTNKKGEEESLQSDVLLMTGRFQPNTGGLGLDRAGVELTNEGHIPVNDVCRTNVDSIFAVGDITDGSALAVKSIKQGKVAAEACAGVNTEFDMNFIPTVARTNPPIISVGLTEEQAKERGYEVHAGQFPLGGNGYAAVIGQKDGFMKVVSDKKTDALLGFHMIGAGAAELAGAGILALETVARDEDLTFPFYPHPSLNEGWLEAVEALKGKAIHAAPARKS